MKIDTRLLELSKRNRNQFYVYEINCKTGEPSIGAHWHNELEILFAECEGIVELDTAAVEFTKGSWIVVNKKQLHHVKAYSDGRIFAMVFDLKILDFKNDDFCQQEIIDALNNQTYLFPQFAGLSKALREEITVILQNTIGLYYSCIPGRELKIKCNLYEIIFLLYSNEKFIMPTEQNSDSEKLSYVKDVIGYMEENYAERITVDDLSNGVHISKYYLIKTFKEITGETPMMFLRNMRLDTSKGFLAEGHSVTQTAFMSGFNNVSYYIRHFKTRNHITPKEYQRKSGRQSEK